MPVSLERPDGAVDVERVWHELHERLRAFIARRVSDRDIVDDVLQEVMLRIHRHAGELTSAPALGAWVHQIARSAIADHYRSAPQRRERAAGIDLEPEPPSPDEEPAGDELRGELAGCLSPLLGRLPPAHREALTLTEVDGVSQAEAARRLGLSPSGMKSRVQRGRAQLRDLLVACCEVELDRRGGVMGYQARSGSCDCGPDGAAAGTG
jgi:RNA polymerase sigma-70 factor, ECF subfamily